MPVYPTSPTSGTPVYYKDKKKKKKGWFSLLLHSPSAFVNDVSDFIHGFIPGITSTASAFKHDFTTGAIWNDEDSQLEDIGRGILGQYKYTYDDLFKGALPGGEEWNPGTSGKRILEHPLGPILDVLTVVSGGLGGAGRVASGVSKSSNFSKATRAKAAGFAGFEKADDIALVPKHFDVNNKIVPVEGYLRNGMLLPDEELVAAKLKPRAELERAFQRREKSPNIEGDLYQRKRSYYHPKGAPRPNNMSDADWNAKGFELVHGKNKYRTAQRRVIARAGEKVPIGTPAIGIASRAGRQQRKAVDRAVRSITKDLEREGLVAIKGLSTFQRLAAGQLMGTFVYGDKVAALERQLEKLDGLKAQQEGDPEGFLSSMQNLRGIHDRAIEILSQRGHPMRTELIREGRVHVAGADGVTHQLDLHGDIDSTIANLSEANRRLDEYLEIIESGDFAARRAGIRTSLSILTDPRFLALRAKLMGDEDTLASIKASADEDQLKHIEDVTSDEGIEKLRAVQSWMARAQREGITPLMRARFDRRSADGTRGDDAMFNEFQHRRATGEQREYENIVGKERTTGARPDLDIPPLPSGFTVVRDSDTLVNAYGRQEKTWGYDDDPDMDSTIGLYADNILDENGNIVSSLSHSPLSAEDIKSGMGDSGPYLSNNIDNGGVYIHSAWTAEGYRERGFLKHLLHRFYKEDVPVFSYFMNKDLGESAEISGKPEQFPSHTRSLSTEENHSAMLSDMHQEAAKLGLYEARVLKEGELPPIISHQGVQLEDKIHGSRKYTDPKDVIRRKIGEENPTTYFNVRWAQYNLDSPTAVMRTLTTAAAADITARRAISLFHRAIPWNQLDGPIPKGWTAVTPDMHDKIVNVLNFVNEDMGAVFGNNSDIELVNMVSMSIERLLSDAGADTTMIVPAATMKQLFPEISKSNHFIKRFFDRQAEFWRNYVLGLRPAWMVNNFLGNLTLLLAEHGTWNTIRALMDVYSDKLFKHKGINKIIGEEASELLTSGFSRTHIDEILNKKYSNEIDMGFIRRVLDTEDPDAPASDVVGRGKLLRTMWNRTLGDKGLERLGQKGMDFNASWIDDPMRTAAMWAELRPAIRKLRSETYHRTGQKMEIDEAIKLVLEDDAVKDELIQKAASDMVDYKDLSPTERQVLRRIFPFYAWMAGITKRTTRLIAERPAMANLMLRSFEEAANTEDLEEVEEYLKQYIKVPDWLENFIPGEPAEGTERYLATSGFNPFASAADVIAMSDAVLPGGKGIDSLKGTSNPLSSMAPAVKGPLEALTGKNFFLGTPLAETRGENLQGTGGDPDMNFAELTLSRYLESFPQYRLMRRTLGFDPDPLKQREYSDFKRRWFMQNAPTNDTLVYYTPGTERMAYLGLPVKNLNTAAARARRQRHLYEQRASAVS